MAFDKVLSLNKRFVLVTSGCFKNEINKNKTFKIHCLVSTIKYIRNLKHFNAILMIFIAFKVIF